MQGVRESDSETIMSTAIRSSCLPCTIDDTPLHVASRDAVSWHSGERWGDDDSAGCEDMYTETITTIRASRDAVSWNSRERWSDDDSASLRPRGAPMVANLRTNR